MLRETGESSITKSGKGRRREKRLTALCLIDKIERILFGEGNN